jgi:hypothetical protein
LKDTAGRALKQIMRVLGWQERFGSIGFRFFDLY